MPARIAFDLRRRLRELYYGDTRRAARFRVTVLLIDLIVIGFFIAAPVIRETRAFLPIDYSLAALLTVDITARMMALPPGDAWWRRPSLWIDLFVLSTLLAPQWLFNLGFLRVLKLWSLVHSDLFWRTIGHRFDDTRWEDITKGVATLLTFVFVVTGFVYTMFVGSHPGLQTYVDALYFTVTTLTTTGFGDVTLPGTLGKLVAIVTMVAGISLFVRLAQAIVRPHKVFFRCPSCGLLRHEPDAVHCKACGALLAIPDEGE